MRDNAKTMCFFVKNLNVEVKLHSTNGKKIDLDIVTQTKNMIRKTAEQFNTIFPPTTEEHKTPCQLILNIHDHIEDIEYEIWHGLVRDKLRDKYHLLPPILIEGLVRLGQFNLCNRNACLLRDIKQVKFDLQNKKIVKNEELNVCLNEDSYLSLAFCYFIFYEEPVIWQQLLQIVENASNSIRLKQQHGKKEGIDSELKLQVDIIKDFLLSPIIKSKFSSFLKTDQQHFPSTINQNCNISVSDLTKKRSKREAVITQTHTKSLPLTSVEPPTFYENSAQPFQKEPDFNIQTNLKISLHHQRLSEMEVKRTKLSIDSILHKFRDYFPNAMDFISQKNDPSIEIYIYTDRQEYVKANPDLADSGGYLFYGGDKDNQIHVYREDGKILNLAHEICHRLMNLSANDQWKLLSWSTLKEGVAEFIEYKYAQTFQDHLSYRINYAYSYAGELGINIENPSLFIKFLADADNKKYLKSWRYSAGFILVAFLAQTPGELEKIIMDPLSFLSSTERNKGGDKSSAFKQSISNLILAKGDTKFLTFLHDYSRTTKLTEAGALQVKPDESSSRKYYKSNGKIETRSATTLSHISDENKPISKLASKAYKSVSPSNKVSFFEVTSDIKNLTYFIPSSYCYLRLINGKIIFTNKIGKSAFAKWKDDIIFREKNTYLKKYSREYVDNLSHYSIYRRSLISEWIHYRLNITDLHFDKDHQFIEKCKSLPRFEEALAAYRAAIQSSKQKSHHTYNQTDAFKIALEREYKAHEALADVVDEIYSKEELPDNIKQFEADMEDLLTVDPYIFENHPAAKSALAQDGFIKLGVVSMTQESSAISILKSNALKNEEGKYQHKDKLGELSIESSYVANNWIFFDQPGGIFYAMNVNTGAFVMPVLRKNGKHNLVIVPKLAEDGITLYQKSADNVVSPDLTQHQFLDMLKELPPQYNKAVPTKSEKASLLAMTGEGYWLKRGNLRNDQGTDTVNDDIYDLTLMYNDTQITTIATVGMYVDYSGEVYLHDFATNRRDIVLAKNAFFKVVTVADTVKLVFCTKTGEIAQQADFDSFSINHFTALTNDKKPLIFLDYPENTIFKILPNDHYIDHKNNPDSDMFYEAEIYLVDKKIGTFANQPAYIKDRLAIEIDHNTKIIHNISIHPEVVIETDADGRKTLEILSGDADDIGGRPVRYLPENHHTKSQQSVKSEQMMSTGPVPSARLLVAQAALRKIRSLIYASFYKQVQLDGYQNSILQGSSLIDHYLQLLKTYFRPMYDKLSSKDKESVVNLVKYRLSDNKEENQSKIIEGIENEIYNSFNREPALLSYLTHFNFDTRQSVDAEDAMLVTLSFIKQLELDDYKTPQHLSQLGLIQHYLTPLRRNFGHKYGSTGRIEAQQAKKITALLDSFNATVNRDGFSSAKTKLRQYVIDYLSMALSDSNQTILLAVHKFNFNYNLLIPIVENETSIGRWLKKQQIYQKLNYLIKLSFFVQVKRDGYKKLKFASPEQQMEHYLQPLQANNAIFSLNQEEQALLQQPQTLALLAPLIDRLNGAEKSNENYVTNTMSAVIKNIDAEIDFSIIGGNDYKEEVPFIAQWFILQQIKKDYFQKKIFQSKTAWLQHYLFMPAENSAYEILFSHNFVKRYYRDLFQEFVEDIFNRPAQDVETAVKIREKYVLYEIASKSKGLSILQKHHEIFGKPEENQGKVTAYLPSQAHSGGSILHPSPKSVDEDMHVGTEPGDKMMGTGQAVPLLPIKKHRSGEATINPENLISLPQKVEMEKSALFHSHLENIDKNLHSNQRSTVSPSKTLEANLKQSPILRSQLPHDGVNRRDERLHVSENLGDLVENMNAFESSYEFLIGLHNSFEIKAEGEMIKMAGIEKTPYQ